MSSLGIVDFVANNLLDEVGATPVWEKIRKHFYAVGVGISLFVLYFTLGIRVECAPAYANGTVIKTDVYSRHVNEYCGNNDQLIVFRYSGCILVAMNGFILVTATYWLYIPNVIKPIRTFSKIRGLISDIHLPLKELKRLMATPMKPHDLLKTPTNPPDLLLKQKQIRELMRLLPSFKEEKDQHQQTTYPQGFCSKCCNSSNNTCTTVDMQRCPLISCSKKKDSRDTIRSCRYLDYSYRTLSTSYRFRNCFLGIIYILTLSGSIYLILRMLKMSYFFYCTYDLTNDRENYVCAVGGTPAVALVCAIVYALVQFIQLIAAIYGQKVALTIVENDNSKYKSEIKYSSIRLIGRFCKSSQSPHSRVLSKLIEFFFSKDFKEAVDKNVNETGIRDDIELRELSLALYSDSFQNLTLSEREYDSKSFRLTIRNSRYKLCNCIKLAKLLVEHELWETLVFLLDNVEDLNTCSRTDKNSFLKLLISFDSLATQDEVVAKLSDEFSETKSRGVSRSSHSLLYYAINVRKGDNFDVACFLLTCCKPANPYVHHASNCTSEPALQYVESRCDVYKINKDYQKLISKIKECNNATGHPDYNCQKVLEDTLRVYEKNPQNNKNIVINMLSRQKFRKWDESASNLFELAAEKEHFEIELALLKAFFPGNPLQNLARQYDEEIKSIPSDRCMRKIFTNFNYELDDCKYLVAHLAETHSWSLLVGLLNNTTTRCDEMSPDQKDFFRKLKIDPEEIEEDSNSNGFGGNIVWAALNLVHEQDRHGAKFSVATFLLLVSEPQILSVIQDANATKRLSEDLRRSDPRNLREDCEKFKEVLAEFELRYLRSRYKKNSNNVEELATILADVPIREWNDQVHVFADLASSKGDWGILISLFNTHLTENNRKDHEISREGSVTNIVRLNINIKPDNVSGIWYLVKANQDPTLSVCDIIIEYFRSPFSHLRDSISRATYRHSL